MPLSAGERLGAFEIVGPLGAGGMGEVYRARDSRLARDVALKVLPAVFLDDPDRMARFAREAQVLASLNHPHIAAIYGLEEQSLVMELVEGPTLEERMRAGPLPIEEVLQIARQIADALEYAHERGVVHRDLKPANVKITPEGVVKVLDFGLAKVAGESAVSGETTNSPTLTMRATQAGIILGTAGYMSPEQASGKAVDRRADIWSFGVVLWEILTGRRLFEGETLSHTLADVLRADIDFARLPPTTPASIRDLLRRCLDRNVKRRLRDIGEARIMLEDALNGATALPAETAPPAATASALRRAVPWCVAAAGVVAASVFALFYLRQTAPDTHATTFTVTAPEKQHFHGCALSPDGRHLVIEVDSGGGRESTYLAIRSMDSIGLRRLPGTDSANDPFWSPDSRSIAFFVRDKLKKIDLGGAPPITICDVKRESGAGLNGTWSSAGIILMTGGGGALRVPASGGVPTAVPVQPGEIRRLPRFLPDGQHYFYAVRKSDAASQLYVGSLSSPQSEALTAARLGVFAPLTPDARQGHLLFVRESNLMAQPFDAARFRLAGDPIRLAENVETRNGCTVSQDGALAYQISTIFDEIFLNLVAGDGSMVPLGAAGTYLDVGVSPDGKRVAFTVSSGDSSDIWLLDLERKIRSRFTFQPGTRGGPVWSPDGNYIVFAAQRNDVRGLYRKAASGTGAEELLLRSERNVMAHDYTRDGRYLVYTDPGPKTGADLWLLAMSGERKPRVYLQTPFQESHGQVSPDGRFLAYESNESGRFEVYVATFPDATRGKWQVSRDGGGQPRWSRDGKELHFLGPGRQLTTAAIKLQPAFESGTPVARFVVLVPATFANANNQRFDYAVAPDGKHLLALATSEAGGNPITVVENWRAKRK